MKSETVTIEKATIWKITTGIFALLFIVVLINGMSGTTPAAPTQPSAQGEQFPTVTVDMKKLADDDAFNGDANAPITIVEFSDYQCPYCKKFFDDTEGQLTTAYIKTGKVRLVYRDFPLSFHVNAQKAAEAAECAGNQGKYWEMHDKIFSVSQGDGTGIAPADLKKLAVGLGLDSAKFDSCLDSGETASEIQKDMQDGGSVGIQGTPGFVIGKTNGNSAQIISGAYPFASFQQIIDAQLAK